MRRFVVGLLAVSACGDPVVGADYRGEPILRITGQVESVGLGSGVPSGAEALVSMFWHPNLARRPPQLLAQDSVSAAIEFPSEFEIRVFEPPTTAHLTQHDGRFGVGVLLVYVDADADAQYDVGERIIGGNLAKAVVWALEPIAAADSPFNQDLPEGFSLVRQPFMACRAPDDEPRGEVGPALDGRVPRCLEDRECPADFACDRRLSICIPAERFALEIGGGFDLSRARCEPM